MVCYFESNLSQINFNSVTQSNLKKLGLNNENLCLFISNFDIFPLISSREMININVLSLLQVIIGQRDIKHNMRFTVKNNNISFGRLDIHYH